MDCESYRENKNIANYFTSVQENAITDISSIPNVLRDFFSNTNRTLYIEIGFEENILNNDDMWSLFNAMEENRDKEPFEMMIEIYKYPEWYKAKDGLKLIRIEESIFLAKKMENEIIKKEIKKLESMIDDLLIKGCFSEVRTTNQKISTLRKKMLSLSR